VAVPTDIANLSVWYKADAITGLSDGAQLAAWPDSSGNGYTTEQPFGLKPTYQTAELNSLPVVRFKSPGDANDAALRSSAPIGDTSKTIFAVVRPSQVGTSATPQDIWAGDGGSLRLRIISSKFDLVKVGVAILVTGTTTPSDGTSYVVCATLVNATSATIHLNGNQDATATHAQTLTASSFTYLGGSGIFGGEPFFGDLAEVVVYDAALPATDRDAITSYLGNKYGITVAGGAPATTAGATTANATGAVPGSAARVIVNAAAANATGAAPAPAASSTQVVAPAAANSTGVAQAGTGLVAARAGTAQAASVAPAAVVTAGAIVTTTVAQAAGTAPSPAAVTAVLAPAVTSGAAAAATTPTAQVAVASPVAATSGTAANAVGTSNSNVVAVALVAHAEGAAAPATTSAVTVIATAATTGQASNATAGSSTSAAVAPTAAQAVGQAVAAASSVTADIGPASATGLALFVPGLSTSVLLIADDAVEATGQALSATATNAMLASAQRASAVGSAGGASVTGEGAEPGPTLIGVAEVAEGAGSAADGRVRLDAAPIGAYVAGSAAGPGTRVLVRPAAAAARGAVGNAQTSNVRPPSRPRAGTPQLRELVVVGAPTAGSATHVVAAAARTRPVRTADTPIQRPARRRPWA
jgi:hypothetical protein